MYAYVCKRVSMKRRAYVCVYMSVCVRVRVYVWIGVCLGLHVCVCLHASAGSGGIMRWEWVEGGGLVDAIAVL